MFIDPLGNPGVGNLQQQRAVAALVGVAGNPKEAGWEERVKMRVIASQKAEEVRLLHVQRAK